MNSFRYFNDARFNFYKDDFAMHTFYLFFCFMLTILFMQTMFL